MFELKNITKTFGDEVALKNVSLSITGGMNYIIGASGSGKTTLLRILSSMDRQYEGIIGHQLARPVNAAQHPGRGHAPGVAGRQRRAGGLGRIGRLRGAGLRHRGWAGRRTLRRALGRAAARRCPGPPVGQFKVVALVTLHIASFLRRNGGTIS